jgi:3-oxoadipate enol-lactonase
MEFIDAAGIAIHVRREPPTAGSPAALAPALVYLHSLGAELRIWDGVVARLPRYGHLRVDLRGHGASEVPAGDYTIAAMAGDVLAALDALHVERVVAVGISVGGQVALRMALAQPDRIVGVVALDTGARIGDEAPGTAASRRSAAAASKRSPTRSWRAGSDPASRRATRWRRVGTARCCSARPSRGTSAPAPPCATRT